MFKKLNEKNTHNIVPRDALLVYHLCHILFIIHVSDKKIKKVILLYSKNRIIGHCKNIDAKPNMKVDRPILKKL